MSENKTVRTRASVEAFLSAVEHPRRREDGVRLHRLFTEVTGWGAAMWGPSIVGYGQYHYVYASGREGDFLATGFSPRKANLSLYIMPGYTGFDGILARLGKHKRGKSCLTINTLADVDLGVLAELITAGLEDLEAHWPVVAS